MLYRFKTRNDIKRSILYEKPDIPLVKSNPRVRIIFFPHKTLFQPRCLRHLPIERRPPSKDYFRNLNRKRYRAPLHPRHMERRTYSVQGGRPRAVYLWAQE